MKWRLLVAGAVAAGLLGLPFYWQTGDDTLEVNGVPFRLWVAQHPDFQIRDPLAAVGTNAIPHFIRILHEPAESPRAFQVKAWIWTHLPRSLQSRFQHWYPVPRWQLKRTALFGLRFLGPEAKVALPEVLLVGHAETNRMVQATALVAALQIAPDSPETFNFWREQWEGTNYSRRDLAIYLRAAKRPIRAAVPLLLEEATKNPVSALEAFEFFGEDARPAVPHMVRLAEGGTYRGNMHRILRRLGPIASDAVPAMVRMLNDAQAESVAGTLEVLKAIGPEAHSALPVIRPLLTHEDSTVRMLAAAALARIEGNPESAVSILLDGLEEKLPRSTKFYLHVDIRQEMPGLVASGCQAAAILLGELGPAARATSLALERRMEDSNEATRIFAAQALWRIGRDKQKVLPVLLKVLNSRQPPAPNFGSSRVLEFQNTL